MPTVTDISAVATAMGVTIGTHISNVVQQNVLDAVITNFKNRTHRTFVPVSETRYFDGNNSGMIEVDDFVTLSTVELVGWYGITNALTLSNYAAVERSGYPINRIQIYKGSIPSLPSMWIDRFPAGRSNVKITALWGFASTVPDDVWQAIVYQASGIVINMSLFKTQGYLIKWQEADVSEVRNYMDPFKFFSSVMDYKGTIKLYKRPSGLIFRKQAKPLV